LDCYCAIDDGVVAIDSTATLLVHYAKLNFAIFRSYSENKSIKKFLMGVRTGELGVNPSILSRWIAGMGSLTQADIGLLATKLSPIVYTFLGLPRPLIDETQTEELIE